MSENLKTVLSPLPDLGCACASLRRAARLVTQLYSDEMSAGVEPAQYSLLSMLSRRPGASQTLLGQSLGLDKTTMSRNLRVLRKNGWIQGAEKDDRRVRGFELTPAGKKLLTAAKPGWERAQSRLRKSLTPGEWDTLMQAVSRASEAASISRRGRAA